MLTLQELQLVLKQVAQAVNHVKQNLFLLFERHVAQLDGKRRGKARPLCLLQRDDHRQIAGPAKILAEITAPLRGHGGQQRRQVVFAPSRGHFPVGLHAEIPRICVRMLAAVSAVNPALVTSLTTSSATARAFSILSQRSSSAPILDSVSIIGAVRSLAC